MYDRDGRPSKRKAEKMLEQFSRTGLLLGEEALKKLRESRVAVFGIGGVGGYVCEALARSGVGKFVLVDSDTICLSNLNRQIIATQETIGRYKVDVMKERILSINQEAQVQVHCCFFLPDNAGTFSFSDYDYVVDAVDTVTAKMELIVRSQQAEVPIICAMGAGNKLDASRFRVADIYKTSVDPLARVIRRECRKRSIRHLKVVYSDEPPMEPLSVEACADEENFSKRVIPGSTAFVPAVAGLILAGEVVKDLTNRE